MKHLDITLTGRVQGVSLRRQIRELAEELGLRGYVRNLRSGEVSIEVEGEDGALKQFIEELEASPGLSAVKGVEVAEAKIKGYRDFQAF